jgi:hypothetical protein
MPPKWDPQTLTETLTLTWTLTPCVTRTLTQTLTQTLTPETLTQSWCPQPTTVLSSANLGPKGPQCQPWLHVMFSSRGSFKEPMAWWWLSSLQCLASPR